MSNQSLSCLSIHVLDQIGRNEISNDELLNIEEHVSKCPRCREMFDSVYDSPQWSEQIRPALSETQLSVSLSSDQEASHQSTILKLLGPTDDPNMLGRIGNYEIVGVIGQGGMGVVFKGFDRSLNRFVAIKMLLPHLAASGASRKRFAREGQAVAAVVDDHVMAIHCVDEWQGVPYLVMTYSRGISLQKRLNDSGPLEVREILRIGMQAAKGLAAAHAQGIVHRDIKPSNILLDQNVERVQLVDFGLARAVDDASLTCSGTLAGTPQYMSPEQARAETIDQRSDLFSLGSVLYAMCVGHAPFRAESSYSVLRLITDQEPRPIREVNPEVPEWLSAIIGKLMSKSPDDRFASADEVAILLEQCLAHVQDPIRHALPRVAKECDGQTKSKWMIVSKLQRWLPIMNDKRIVSLISLILFIMALLGPWPLATLGNRESALAFAGSAALLSFGLALLSRTEYFSRIVLGMLGLTIGIAILGIGISVPIWMARESRALAIAREDAAVAEMRAMMEANKQQLKAESEAKDEKSENDRMTQKQSAIRSQIFQKYAPDKLEAARKAGKVVILDFTADWCLNDKKLKATALNRYDVMEAINSKDVVPIGVDLTADNAPGWDLLREYGQSSIPLLVIEGPGTQKPWQSNSYTASEVIEALAAARKGKKNEVERANGTPDATQETRKEAAVDAHISQGRSNSPIAVVMVMHPAELRNGNTIQRAAATKTLSLLTDKDYCGILSYGQVQGKSDSKWLWGNGSALEEVGGHRKDWNAAIAESTTGDFPDFRPAFQMAFSAMKEVNAKQKAMIVFTDGDPVFDDESLIDKFRDAGIKVSVIQVDIHRINRRSLLERIVDATGGAYHYVLESQAAVVEKLFVREIQTLRLNPNSSLEKIGLAFHMFHEKVGSFPGSRMKYLDRRKIEFEHPFSWRVAILPYIGQQQLFDDYRFDEPWDSQNNISLLDKMPDIYRSPHAPSDQPPGNTNLLGFASEVGGLGLNSGETMSSFTDGTSNTILIVETAQSVPWTKPEDLTESIALPIAGQLLRFVLADGSVSQMNPVDAVKLAKMITRNGGESMQSHGSEGAAP